MPIPINPVHGMGYRKDHGSLLDSIDVSMFGDFLPAAPAKNKIITASDKDASLLLTLWHKKSENSELISANGINNNDILRLKTTGFLTGDVDNVKFTQKAKAVITTMVLNEPNRFLNNKQQKNYNEILAEQNKKFKGSRIPKFASSNPQFSNDNLISLASMTDGGNEIVPSGLFAPNASTPYFYENRVTKGTNPNLAPYKEYTVRIYIQNGLYHVWAFRGKIGGTQTMEYKGNYINASDAGLKVSFVLNARSGYLYSHQKGYVVDPNPSTKPGTKVSNVEANVIKQKQKISKAPITPTPPTPGMPEIKLKSIPKPEPLNPKPIHKPAPQVEPKVEPKPLITQSDVDAISDELGGIFG